jgi:hypothetical protein
MDMRKLIEAVKPLFESDEVSALSIGDKVSRAVSLHSGTSSVAVVQTVTNISGDKVYLNNSKQPMKFPDRLMRIEAPIISPSEGEPGDAAGNAIRDGDIVAVASNMYSKDGFILQAKTVEKVVDGKVFLSGSGNRNLKFPDRIVVIRRAAK